MQLLWRGAVAGLLGQLIGTGISVYVSALLYLLWGFPGLQLFAMVLGMFFIFVIGAIQKFAFELKLLARSIVGGLIGVAASCVWYFGLASKYAADSGAAKWFACVMVAIGIVAGILCRPLSKEVQKQPEQPSDYEIGEEPS